MSKRCESKCLLSYYLFQMRCLMAMTPMTFIKTKNAHTGWVKKKGAHERRRKLSHTHIHIKTSPHMIAIKMIITHIRNNSIRSHCLLRNDDNGTWQWETMMFIEIVVTCHGPMRGRWQYTVCLWESLNEWNRRHRKSQQTKDCCLPFFWNIEKS